MNLLRFYHHSLKMNIIYEFNPTKCLQEGKEKLES